MFRLQGHACVLVLGGNNEVENSFPWFPTTSRANPSLYAVDFARLFLDTIRSIIEETGTPAMISCICITECIAYFVLPKCMHVRMFCLQWHDRWKAMLKYCAAAAGPSIYVDTSPSNGAAASCPSGRPDVSSRRCAARLAFQDWAQPPHTSFACAGLYSTEPYVKRWNVEDGTGEKFSNIHVTSFASVGGASLQ